MTQFKSRKDTFFTVLVLGLNLFFFWMILTVLQKETILTQDYIALLVIVASGALILWFFYDTHYTLDKEYLVYKSGPVSGKVAIESIREIEKGKTLWSGLKPATAVNGLIVKFDKFDEIYITPETNDSFVEAILNLNSDIIIKK